ncbi:hypothetical protein A2574_03660 [Candidatus Shapirobacteria bacterium RIFOXYD1_FULL_38_32]|uniref:DUF5666 domain-containing protein n=2 Tax=Candidatus Shapironibacteriota TaxID=1752721 RepID=A0A0G0M9Z3_9BACT|nr:MAG: hypothetical protein US90_C0006G0067 [Candidatus Shapirobacteria bacterium GW2011_GWE2_38_30]KKQ89302.1 MAG: hypothetical protein UT14_C0062G0004 [Candidatus Shapirobacteria bacterium GW2011_GWE1_38_92]OGL54991.1 MAG: hypothetical protein A2195_01625 [Candidatus Shapirobacteria bacterium RIFOXYA1_FULL_39_17]OGL57651.1 MAG: hypothetical protein A2410_02325 [Candidatus Shapirobacteria bacterium RIFOXYC1_FULL_38_24]OGL58054.1 MAG: hypothetical protein A2574_03660 [Candidatus Shapirobacteri
MKNNLILTILVIALFTGIGFFVGTKYQQTKAISDFRQQIPGGGLMRGDVTGDGIQNKPRGIGQIIGEIISADEKSITVKMTDGSSKIILINDKTAINKATQGTVSDLKVGEKVAVFGVTNADGSVSGQNIQLNPTRNPSP